MPTFWAPKLYWMVSASESGVWLVALLGFAYQMLLVFALSRRFYRVLHQ